MMNKNSQLYDDNKAACADDGIFGLAYTQKDARVCLVPVPFEATASFHLGTLNAPQAILKASEQLDLYHPLAPRAWEQGISLLDENPNIRQLNQTLFENVSTLRNSHNDSTQTLIDHINEQTTQLHHQVTAQCTALLNQNKRVGLIGGDHSTAWGNIAAHVARYPDMGILHFDAHDDLRQSYEGFIHSHASIFYNVLENLPLKKLVSLGIRDYCQTEQDYAEQHIANGRLSRFTQDELNQLLFKNMSWDQCCQRIAAELPPEVYISLDIDGLDPTYCPHTGTPVPGGLSFQQVVYLLRYLVQHDHRIVGFDCVEVGAHEYDANVGARLLYEMCVLSLLS